MLLGFFEEAIHLAAHIGIVLSTAFGLQVTQHFAQYILIAGLVGALLPRGPIISFPVAIALMELGAGTPQLVAFLTAWSAFAMHRLLMWEIPLMGMAFASKRLLVSVVLPPIAGLIAWAMLA